MMFYESTLRILPGVRLPVRSTLLQLSHGAVLISPIDFTENQIKSIRELTPVTDIIAPNLHHNRYLAGAARRFPGSTFWASPGMKEKHPELAIHKVLGESVWPFRGELEMLRLDGAPSMNEYVFFDVKSKTLFVTDLVFNIKRPIGLLSPLIFWKFGTYKRFAVSKFWLKFVKDPTVFESSLKTMLEWDFTSIVMAHGEILTDSIDTPHGESAKQRLEASLRERGFLMDLPKIAGLLQSPKST